LIGYNPFIRKRKVILFFSIGKLPKLFGLPVKIHIERNFWENEFLEKILKV